jgi:AraC-like DNA-binding protein
VQRQGPQPGEIAANEDVRIGPLRPIQAVLRELGHDEGPVLRASGLEPTAFDDPDRRLPFRVAADLIRRGALLAGREDFGLLVGARFGLGDLGLLGQLIWRATTVGQALHELNRFLPLQDRGSVVYVQPVRPGVVSLGYAVFDAEVPGVALVYDLVLAIGLRLLQALAGPGFRALEAWLPHAAPRLPVAYRRVFGAPLKFDAPRAEIHFAADWLRASVVGADAVQHLLVQRAIREAEAAVAQGMAARARAVVRVLLMSGDASAQRVADALGLHERTLRRRLEAEGESLQALVAQARFDIARQLLRDTRLGLRDIAEALGYAEAPVFVRAFRGWAGCTPGQWRARDAASPRPRAGC